MIIMIIVIIINSPPLLDSDSVTQPVTILIVLDRCFRFEHDDDDHDIPDPDADHGDDHHHHEENFSRAPPLQMLQVSLLSLLNTFATG